MNSDALSGVLLGLVTAFFIGLFMVPRRYTNSNSVTFLVGMTAGAALGSTFYWLAMGRPFQVSLPALLSLVPGLNWACGTYAYAWGTSRVGLAKATGIKNTQVVVTTLGGFLFFNEGRSTHPLIAALGAALVVATAVVLSRTQHREESVPNASAKGYLIPVLASLSYGANGIMMTWLIRQGVPRPQMNLLIGAGAVAGGITIYILVSRRADFLTATRPKNHALAVLGGVIWAAALVTMIISIAKAGVAVAWSLMNLSVVVGVLYGVVILHEIDRRAMRRRVAGGLALACLGILALYLSKILV